MNEDVKYHLLRADFHFREAESRAFFEDIEIVAKIRELRYELQKIINLYKKIEEVELEELWNDEQLEQIKIEAVRLREEIKKSCKGGER